MRKGMIMVLAAGMMLSVFAGQAAMADEAFDPSQYTIGFSMAETSSEWASACASFTQDPLEEAGWNVQYSDAQNQQEAQIAALRSFIAQEVDAIIVRPVTTTGWDTVIAEVKDAGIPLIVFGRKIEPAEGVLTDYALCYVGPDNVYAGELIAQAAIDYFAEAEGPVNLVVLEGTVGASAAIERTEGINNAIAKQDKVKILDSQSGNFSREEGKRVMEAIIKAAESNGDKIDAVIGENDDMALGAMQALTESGYNCGTDVWLGGVDGVFTAFEAMVDGTYNATVENPLQYGVEIDKILTDYFTEGTIPEPWIVLKNDIYLQDVAADVIDSRPY